MLAIKDVADYLQQQGEKDQLRFLTCGSVDDGKSTLLGRLLYDSSPFLKISWMPPPRKAAALAPREAKWIWPCWWTVCRRSGNRALPLM
ncbi:hypothetical protein [Aliamphritea spongicola]|nr:hypothetical protein [Aliamphritea spongicola]